MLCSRLTSWVESLSGITRFRFRDEGVVPFRGGDYFRYADEQNLAPCARASSW
jgi:hypothetical protein